MKTAMHQVSVAGSVIGGIRETQDMLDFCAEHQTLPEVQMIKIQDINDVLKDMLKEETLYRYAIDMQLLK